MTSTRGTSLPRRKHWSDNALCRGLNTEDFFPRGTTGVFLLHIEEAKKVCRACPVAMACAQDALTDRIEHGVWGGLDEDQRRRLLKTAAQDRVDSKLTRLIQREWARDTMGPLVEAYLKRTDQGEDGHVRWTVGTTVVRVADRMLTPRQLAFELGHGRRPDGIVRVTCEVAHCVAPEHLADSQLRRLRDHASAA